MDHRYCAKSFCVGFVTRLYDMHTHLDPENLLWSLTQPFFFFSAVRSQTDVWVLHGIVSCGILVMLEYGAAYMIGVFLTLSLLLYLFCDCLQLSLIVQ